MKLKERKKGSLVLSDGSVYEGEVFGYDKPTSGELAFNTAMTGYPESLSDPSYAGQIVLATYPLQGNYGLPSWEKDDKIDAPINYEGDRLYPKAFIVHDLSEDYSHWNASESLSEGLKKHKVVGLSGIDTRALTKKLRQSGAMMGKILIENEADVAFINYDEINLVDEVSCKEPIIYEGGEKKIVLIDCGVKYNIIRNLLSRNLTVIRVPWDYDFTELEFDGLFISNGPGNPKLLTKTVEHIKKTIEKGIPTAGICLGNQLIALAIGADIKKMQYGHRSHNQPVRMVGTNTCFITSQNHGFEVDDSSLPEGWSRYFTNLNNDGNEGLIHESGKFFSVQFHPEATGGPTDTLFIFNDFVAQLNK